jgi:hypothetical protein
MLRISTLLASAAAILAVAAAPAHAAKKPLPGLKIATFDATLAGSQVTTWHFDDTDDPNDPCDGASRGDGSQQIRFATKTVRLRVMHGRSFKRPSFVMPMINGTATVEREGDYTVLPTPYDEDACGPPVAIGDGNGDGPPPKDCGTRETTMILQPGYDNDLQSDPDDFLVPLVEPTSLRLDGNLGPYETFQECPYWVGGGTGPSEDALLQSWAEAAPFKRFYEKRRKSMVFSGDRDMNFTAPNFTGRTLIAWNLRLKRVK